MIKKFILFSLTLLLASCGYPNESTQRTDLAEPSVIRDENTTAEPAPDSESSEESEPTSVELNYASSAFRLDEIGFELRYPQDWMVDEGVLGSRAFGATFTSWQHPAGQIDQVPEGESILSLTVYQWDPKNDLDAYIQTRMRDNWSASDIQILAEEEVILESGQRAVRFTVRNETDGAEAFFLVTLAGDQYLVLSGSGDLTLLEEIALTGRFNN